MTTKPGEVYRVDLGGGDHRTCGFDSVANRRPEVAAIIPKLPGIGKLSDKSIARSTISGHLSASLFRKDQLLRHH